MVLSKFSGDLRRCPKLPPGVLRIYGGMDLLNYYRLEAGRFEDFVSYGLKSFAHEGVTKTRWSPSPDTIPT